MAISLEKLERQAPRLVSLRKTVDLTLQNRPQMQRHQAKVALALDYSGSMRGLYKNGSVQQIAERALALATAFDDDSDIDIFIFESRAHYVGTLALDNYQGGIDRLVSRYQMGSDQLCRRHASDPLALSDNKSCRSIWRWEEATHLCHFRHRRRTGFALRGRKADPRCL